MASVDRTQTAFRELWCRVGSDCAGKYGTFGPSQARQQPLLARLSSRSIGVLRRCRPTAVLAASRERTSRSGLRRKDGRGVPVGVNLADPRRADARGWGPMWSPPAPRRTDMVPLVVAGVSFVGGVHPKLHDLLETLWTEAISRGYELKTDPTQTWDSVASDSRVHHHPNQPLVRHGGRCQQQVQLAGPGRRRRCAPMACLDLQPIRLPVGRRLLRAEGPDALGVHGDRGGCA